MKEIVALFDSVIPAFGKSTAGAASGVASGVVVCPPSPKITEPIIIAKAVMRAT